MYRQIKQELSGARFSKRVHVSPSRPSWRRINPPLVDGKNRRSKPRTTTTGVEKSESRNLCLGKRRNKQLERGLHGSERERKRDRDRERERKGVGILSAGYKSAHSMSRTSHHREKQKEGEEGGSGGSKVSKRDRLFGYQPENWDVGAEWNSAVGIVSKDRRALRKTAASDHRPYTSGTGSCYDSGQPARRFKEEFLSGSDRAASLWEMYEWMNCAARSKGFSLPFFFFFLFLSFLPLSFSFSPCCLLEWVYWEYRRFCRDLLCGRELCGGGVEVCRGEWMRSWWVCLEF